MTIERDTVLASIAASLPAAPVTAAEGTFELATVAAGWLAACRAVGGEAPTVADLDAVCRQIDVRHRLSTGYRTGWKRTDPEVAAPATTVATVVAVLLAVAERDPGRGRDLKLVNSALKALELTDDAVTTPSLRAWAVELLDRATIGDGG